VIPVRVPATTRPPEVGGPKHVAMSHPLAAQSCPACDRALGGTDIVLVVVGANPDDRGAPGARWVQAGAVPVHVRCSLGSGR
jgi:hypothetical protein